MTKLALLLVLPLVLLSLGGVMIVDVHEGGPGGHHIWLPVPLAVAQAALVFAPAEARQVEVPELRQHLPAALAVMDALKGQPDFTLVEVRDGDEHVVVRKEGDRLIVEVDEDGGDQVRCRLPLKTARRVLKACADGKLRTRDAVAALQFMPRGQLVHVLSDEDEVSIRML